jgi:hypothetical protein
MSKKIEHSREIGISKTNPLIVGLVGETKRMQLHTGVEHFGNVIFRHSELTPQFHFGASIDVNLT